MQLPRFKARLVLLHSALWIGFALYEQLILFFNNPHAFRPLLVGLTYLLNALVFYSNGHLLLPSLYARRHYVAYGGAVLAVIGAYAFARNEVFLSLPTWLGLAPVPGLGAYWPFWLLSVYRGSFFVFVSTGYWFARNAVAAQVHRRQQEHELRLAERSLLEANLALLKSQINPHFLFNALNFLYAQVFPHSQPAAQGILLLSDTMRYALQDEQRGKVMLSQEVNHLHNYIALNQLRFNNQLQLLFQVEGNLQFALIPPLVLLTFVENCFKHGELTDAANPLAIQLTVYHNHLTFRTYNKKRHGPKELSTGIGLANTRKRLDLMYPGHYTLTVTDSPAEYSCLLTIDL